MSEQKKPSMAHVLAQIDIKGLSKTLSKNLEDFEFVAPKMITWTYQSIQRHHSEEAAVVYLDEVNRGLLESVENLIKKDPSRAPVLQRIAERFRRRLRGEPDAEDTFIGDLSFAKTSSRRQMPHVGLI